MEAVVSLTPEITDFIKNVVEEQNISDFTITDVKTNPKGEGFSGHIFMVSIKEKNGDRRLELIIKAAFADENVRKFGAIDMAYRNETYFYQQLNPAYRKFRELHKIKYYKEIAPRCFKVNTEKYQEMLALENLKTQGFEIFDKSLLMDHDHFELIFKTYGKFHAHGYALRDQNPEEYTKLVENLGYIYGEFLTKGMFGNYLADTVKMAETTLVPGEDDEILEKLKKYEGPNVGKIFEEVTNINCNFSTVLHGDCWSNNMLFKYEEQEGRRIPVDIRLIDWQILKTGSPVCDLSYCLYTGASKEIFDRLADYLKIYHDSLSSFLRELGSDPEQVFPFSALEEHWRKYSKFGMIVSFGLVRMKLTSSETVLELTDAKDLTNHDQLVAELGKTKFNEEEYRKRMRDVLIHMNEIGVL